jgi:hypothetical protein
VIANEPQCDVRYDRNSGNLERLGSPSENRTAGDDTAETFLNVPIETFRLFAQYVQTTTSGTRSSCS